MAKKRKSRPSKLKGQQFGYPTGGGPAGMTPAMQGAMSGGIGPMGNPGVGVG